MWLQMNKGNLDHEDVVQLTFLHLVAGNATMVNLIALVSGRTECTCCLACSSIVR